MSNSVGEIMVPPKAKRGKHDESEDEEIRDRLSDLPDCVLLHVLSFLNTKYAVRTCVLSTRWKHLWKHIPTLILHSSDFWTFKGFAKFVSMILSLRDGSTALQGLDFRSRGLVEPDLLKRIVKYVISHNVQRLGISLHCDIQDILPCFSSSQTLTSLKLSVYPKDRSGKPLFPKSLNLPALTSLDLVNFAFCASDNCRACAEPFSAFIRLKSLILQRCTVRDAKILCISSRTLVNLTMQSNHASEFFEIELSAPSLCSFAFTGTPRQKLCGRNLSSVTQVNIDAVMLLNHPEPPLLLLSWLQELAHIKSLTVTASTLQVLSLVPDLLMLKLPSLSNLKLLKIKLEPLMYGLTMILRAVELQKAAAKSRKEAAKLRKAFKAGLEPSPPIPDEVVDFLLQNSPSAEVHIIDCSRRFCFNCERLRADEPPSSGGTLESGSSKLVI